MKGKVFLYACAGLVWASLPFMASAAGLLPDCAGVGTTCNLCDLVSLVQKIINFLIGLSIPIAVLLFAYAGFQYFTSAGNTGKIEDAHKIFGTAGIGFLIAITGWLVVDVIIHTIVAPHYFDSLGSGGNWYSISCTGNRPQDGDVGKWLNGVFNGGSTNNGNTNLNTLPPVSGNTSNIPPSSGGMDGDLAAAQLQQKGISVQSSGNCSDPSNSSCTSLFGIQSATVNQVISLKQECGCDIVVTGGTEAGHASGDLSHSNGYKIDLKTTPTLTNYIQQNFSSAGTRSGSNGGSVYADSSGNQYVLEGSPPHWDVTVKS